MRKGIFPAVGAVRVTGTTVIIEDVAFPVEHLAAATMDLQHLLQQHGYTEAVVFGHALAGNLHFVFTQDIGRAAEVERYSRLMEAVCALVVDTYDGSLKAEHGTGRNMAPFVEREWGTQAYALMQRIKALLDPQGLLNPGVILNADPQAHLKNLKPLPGADPLIDKCIECGFCELKCPSRGLTLSPGQRIVGWREIARLDAAQEPGAQMKQLFDYHGIETCAACGLCAMKGALDTLRKASGGRLPKWSPALARPVHFVPHPFAATRGERIVYFPSCAARNMGPQRGDEGVEMLPQTAEHLFQKAGFDVRYPAPLDGLCCGQPFESKGLADAADLKSNQLEAALRDVSEGGR